MANIVDLGGEDRKKPSDEEIAAELTRLAELSSLEYERQRRQAAAYTMLRLSTLDELVDERRSPASDSQARIVQDRESSLTSVDGSSILDNLTKYLRKYVSLRDDAAVAVPLWVMHTYCLGATFISPRLAITAPEPRCGKTTLINWLSTVVERPLSSVNVSPAAVYHVVDQRKPTLLIDEADTFLSNNNELRGILNSGHQRNGFVVRWDQRIKGLREFSTFSACAISMIGSLPNTLVDRSIRVRLRRRHPDEEIISLRPDQVSHRLANQCARWASDNAGYLSEPDMPKELTNRVADNWRPLLALADRVGGEWPAMARVVAVSTAETDSNEVVSPGVRLLAEIRELLGGRLWMSSEELVAALADRGMPMSQKALANKLSPYEIAPRKHRIGYLTERGYKADWFADAFARYLPPGTTATNGTNVPDVPDVSGLMRQREKTMSRCGLDE
jgi:putative DNA primase/helicase